MIYNDFILRKRTSKLEYFLCVASVCFWFFFPVLSILFFAILSSHVKQKILNVVFGFMVLISATVFYSSLQPFSDLAEYLYIYNDVGFDNISIFQYERFGGGLEWIILVIMKVVHILSGGDQQIFLMVYYVIFFTLLMVLCNKIAGDLFILMFACLFFTLGFVESVSYILRQNMSVIFFLMGCLSFSSCNRVLFWLLGFFSHIAIIFQIVIYEIFKRGWGYQSICVLIVFLMILPVLFLLLPSFSEVFFMKYDSVVQIDKFNKIKGSYLLLTLLNSVFVIISFYLSRRERYSQFLSERYFGFLSVFVFNLLILGMYFDVPTIPNRMCVLLFSFLPFFFCPLLMNKLVSSKVKITILSFYLLINIFPFFYSMYNVTSGRNSYTFLNRKPLTNDIFSATIDVFGRIGQELQFVDQGNE